MAEPAAAQFLQEIYSDVLENKLHEQEEESTVEEVSPLVTAG